MESSLNLLAELQDRFNLEIDGIIFKHVKNGRQAFDLDGEIIDSPTAFISLQAFGKDSTTDNGEILQLMRTVAITIISNSNDTDLSDYVDLILENIQEEPYLTERTSIEFDSATAMFNNEKDYFTINLNLISNLEV